VKNEIVPVLEQRLNKDNCTQLQRLADRDFAFFRKYKIQGDFIDIRSKQDGTILKNFNSTLFHPNGQFTYAVYGLEQRVLIDLNKVILYPLPHGLRFLDGEPCRDPVAWSSDGKYYVLQNNENFYTDKSISGQEKISYKSRLSVMNAEKNQAIFETEIDGIVGSVAWSPDLASLAVVSNFYHYHTDMPWQWLPGKLRIAREHYTYNLELFNLSTGEKQKYALSQDSKLWALDDLIWIK